MTALKTIKILRGNVVSQTTLGGLTIHPDVAISYSVHMPKNYESWLTVGLDNVITTITIQACILAHPVYISTSRCI